MNENEQRARGREAAHRAPRPATLHPCASAARAFSDKWKGVGNEKQHTQVFWLELLREVYGVEKPFAISDRENWNKQFEMMAFLNCGRKLALIYPVCFISFLLAVGLSLHMVLSKRRKRPRLKKLNGPRDIGLSFLAERRTGNDYTR